MKKYKLAKKTLKLNDTEVMELLGWKKSRAYFLQSDEGKHQQQMFGLIFEMIAFKMYTKVADRLEEFNPYNENFLNTD